MGTRPLSNKQTKKNFGKLQMVALCFQNIAIDVDLVQYCPGMTPTEVDCSANNLMLSDLELKLKTTGYSHKLSTVIDNVKKKEFHFYMNWGYRPDYCKIRLEKLLNKGYTCLSGVPSVQRSGINPNLLHLIRDSKF